MKEGGERVGMSVHVLAVLDPVEGSFEKLVAGGAPDQ
jgi:hypothetical protein